MVFLQKLGCVCGDGVLGIQKVPKEGAPRQHGNYHSIWIPPVQK
jgi:hypothetical protein